MSMVFCPLCNAEGFVKTNLSTKAILDCGHVVNRKDVAPPRQSEFIPRRMKEPRTEEPRAECPPELKPVSIPLRSVKNVARVVADLLDGKDSKKW